MVRTVNFITDVLLPFITNRLLLEGLAISDVQELATRTGKRNRQIFPYREHVEWEIRFGNTVPLILGGTRDSDAGLSRGEMARQVSELPLVGVPGGYLGIQAFYLILENFWRNLIKHGAEQVSQLLQNLDKKLRISIEIGENHQNDYSWEFKLWSNVEVPNISGTVEKIRKGLESGIISKDNLRLIPEGWGTKEMLIGAAYLMGRDLESINDNAKLSRHVLRCSNKDNYLLYSFDVLKAINLSIFTNVEIDITVKKRLLAKGINSQHVPLKENKPVPTEYIVLPVNYALEHTSGTWPVKQFRMDFAEADIKQLVLADSPFDILIDLESLFIHRLAKDQHDAVTNGHEEPICLAVHSASEDEKVLTGISISTNKLRVTTQEYQSAAELKGNAFAIVFDHHGNKKQDIFQFYQENPEGLFWEPYGGGTHTAFLLSHVSKDSKQQLYLISTIVTSCLLKVVILDERIQQFLEQRKTWKYGDGPELEPLDVFRKMRVYVPPIESCSLTLPREDLIANFIAENKPHILSVHCGILDKMSLRDLKEVRAWVQRTREFMHSNVQQVILHSGRGVPSNVPEEVPFVSYTAVEHWMTSKDLKSKYALVQELLSARGLRK